ncbi:uncharacterized protein LOC105446948 [Strongylocentrotus purpuratus]|uniref:Death domain-containing protein n=1 Tax=Strongylocentrotus purpuratus TaxID=7668 RepID=A0A7M7HQ22_STRPU|nr:uncharacterized protein LOC105446948 [Strongylocentrotus purpuratus]
MTMEPKRISEIELINLAKRISPSYYKVLGNNLEFCQAELENLSIRSQLDIQEAIHTILRRWTEGRPLNENSREVLADILDDTELKAIGDLLRTGHESLLKGSSKSSGLDQRASTSQTPAIPGPMKSSAETTPKTTTSTTTKISTSSSSPQSSDSITVITGLIAGLLPHDLLPQHHSHVYNATSSDTVKVVLTSSRGDDITHVLNPRNHCRIPTPYGRVRLSVYRKDDNGDGGFARDACALFADDSDRSFIVKKSSDGKNLVVVRSKYGQFRTEERP